MSARRERAFAGRLVVARSTAAPICGCVCAGAQGGSGHPPSRRPSGSGRAPRADAGCRDRERGDRVALRSRRDHQRRVARRQGGRERRRGRPRGAPRHPLRPHRCAVCGSFGAGECRRGLPGPGDGLDSEGLAEERDSAHGRGRGRQGRYVGGRGGRRERRRYPRRDRGGAVRGSSGAPRRWRRVRCLRRLRCGCGPRRHRQSRLPHRRAGRGRSRRPGRAAGGSGGRPQRRRARGRARVGTAAAARARRHPRSRVCRLRQG